VDSIWNAFCDILNTEIDNCVPLKTNMPIEAKSAKPKIGYPPGIQRAIARTRCLWRQHKMRPTDSQAAVTYRIASNRCQLLIRNYEPKREQKVIDSNNTGSFFNFVNKKLTCKKGVGVLRDEQSGNTVSGDEEQANMNESINQSII